MLQAISMYEVSFVEKTRSKGVAGDVFTGSHGRVATRSH